MLLEILEDGRARAGGEGDLFGGHEGSRAVGIEGRYGAALTCPLADLLPESQGLGAVDAEGGGGVDVD